MQLAISKGLCHKYLTLWHSRGNKFKPALWWVFFTCLIISTVATAANKPRKHTPSAIQTVMQKYAGPVDRHLKNIFQRHHAYFMPHEISLLTFKKEGKMELWSKYKDQWRFIKTYPLLANSGGLGPKLRQGDAQIPEGVYHIRYLNPHSHFHLSMKINYPNAFDIQHAQHDHRHHLGGDIFIHGKNSSAGCLAIGDKAIEELFVLVNQVGPSHVKVIIAPYDMRTDHHRYSYTNKPTWLPDLYQQVQTALMPFSKKLHA